MNCGKCQSPLTYGVPACAVCGTPVAWDLAPTPPPQPMSVAVPTMPQPQAGIIAPTQTIPTSQPAIQPTQTIASPQSLQQSVPQPAPPSQYFQSQPMGTDTHYAQPSGQPAQYMQPPAILAAIEPTGNKRVSGIMAAAITAIILGAVQLLISLTAFTDEEIAATSGSGVSNVVIGAVCIALGIALIKVRNQALLLKLCIGFVILSIGVVAASVILGVARYHFIIAVGFAGFALWKVFRSR